METTAHTACRFADFRLDRLHHRLTGPDGATVELPARAYDLLIYLLEHRDRVVGKDELMKAVWPHTVVEENNLNQAVTALRRALNDRREAPRFLRTVAGRGYRFVAEVVEESGEASGRVRADAMAEPQVATSPPVPPIDLPPGAPSELPTPPLASAAALADAPDRQRRLLVGVGLLTLGAAGAGLALRYLGSSQEQAPRTIAVLPFKPLLESGDEALQLGMADTLIYRLSGLPGLVVRPLSSVRNFGGVDQDPLQAARELKVDAVLDGSIRISDNRVRISARLLNTASGAALWSGRFDESLSNFLAAQDALADQVVSALRLQLGDADRRRVQERPTDDVQAWQLYQNGRYYWERKEPSSTRRALEYFKAAEQRDPSFGLAIVGQADCWAVLGVWSAVPPAEAFSQAGKALERALAIDPDLPEAQASMGHVLVQGRRLWRDGERWYRRALNTKPDLAQARMWVANDSAYLGRMDESLREARRASDLEPLSLTFGANVGLIHYMRHDYDAAREQLEPLVEAAPEFKLGRLHLARVLIAAGSADRALAMLEGVGTYGPGAVSTHARAYAATGQAEHVRELIGRLDGMGAAKFGVGFDLALSYAAVGNVAQALDALERATTDGSQMIGFLNCEPGLDALRRLPRFRAVSTRLRLG